MHKTGTTYPKINESFWSKKSSWLGFCKFEIWTEKQEPHFMIRKHWSLQFNSILLTQWYWNGIVLLAVCPKKRPHVSNSYNSYKNDPKIKSEMTFEGIYMQFFLWWAQKLCHFNSWNRRKDFLTWFKIRLPSPSLNAFFSGPKSLNDKVSVLIRKTVTCRFQKWFYFWFLSPSL